MKARLKTLYMDDGIDSSKPGTFYVELRRWKGKYGCDYVLETQIVTTEKADKQPVIDVYPNYKTRIVKSLLDAKDDGHAIRIAVTKREKLAVEAGKLKNMLAEAAS